MKRTKNFLIFTIRVVIPVQIEADIFLSPFEILNLVLSITFNSINFIQERPQKLAVLVKKNSDIGENKIGYSISFNCMRHPLKVPISYAEDCRLGVYQLAEQML